RGTLPALPASEVRIARPATCTGRRTRPAVGSPWSPRPRLPPCPGEQFPDGAALDLALALDGVQLLAQLPILTLDIGFEAAQGARIEAATDAVGEQVGFVAGAVGELVQALLVEPRLAGLRLGKRARIRADLDGHGLVLQAAVLDRVADRR